VAGEYGDLSVESVKRVHDGGVAGDGPGDVVDAGAGGGGQAGDLAEAIGDLLVVARFADIEAGYALGVTRYLDERGSQRLTWRVGGGHAGSSSHG
jgi:hypothetical protein